MPLSVRPILAVILLLLTGVGPLLAWRKTSIGSLKRHFTMPTILAAVTGALCVALGMRDGWAICSFAISAFVTATIFMVRAGTRSTLLPLHADAELGWGPGEIGLLFTSRAC